MEHRNELRLQGDTETVAIINKQIRRQLATDKKSWTLDTVDRDLSIKDRWLGLKQMKSKFQPQMYEKYDMEGKRALPKDHARVTAEYLHAKQWGDTDQHTTTRRTH